MSENSDLTGNLFVPGPARKAGEVLYIEASMHEAKTNLSRYLRELEEGRARALIIRRYGYPAAVVVPYEKGTLKK